MNREKNWYSYTNADLERAFRTDGAKGLSNQEAQRRLRHGKNTVWQVRTASVKGYALRSFLDLATVLLFLTVIAAAVFGSTDMAVAVCVILAVGRIARIGTYIWAERVFEKNAREALPRAKVVRGGTVKIVASDMVAEGDVIILDSGDTVPCDIRLTAADNILVAEGTVTGRDGIVKKNSEVISGEKDSSVPIEMRTNTVYASSVVLSGFAIGIAVATGDNTLICTREGRITLAGEKDVSTVEKLSDWGRACSLCLIAAALIITVLGIFFSKGSLADTFLPSIAMAAAGLGEYIAALGAFAWANKLCRSDDGVLSRASVAEKAANTQIMVLRSIDVVKSGKTTLHSYYSNGKLTMMGTKDAKVPTRLLRLACYCTGTTPEGNVAQGALGVRERYEGVLPYRLVHSMWDENKKDAKKGSTEYTPVQHIPAGDAESAGLDSVLLAKGNNFYFAVMGDAREVLALSSYVRIGGEKVPMSEEERAKISAFASELVKHGVTIAAIGFRDSQYNSLRRISVLQSSLCFEGFIAVADRAEEGVVQALGGFRAAGGRMVVFSEKGEEDKFYAEAEGIFKTGDLYLPKEESAGVRGLSLEEGGLTFVETAGGTAGIKERLRFVKLCRESELSVTYVGYGVEDMWNMKNADVAFAVPTKTGVLPQGIRTEAHGIAESHGGGGLAGVCKLMDKCRIVLLNIRNMLNYLIVSHVCRLILMILCVAAGLCMPSAAALAFWGVVLDFFVCFATAMVNGGGANTNLRAGHISATPEGRKEILFPTLFGTLCAVLSLCVSFGALALLKYAGFDIDITDNNLVSSAVLACMFAMPFVGAEYGSGYGLLSKKSKLPVWYIIPLGVCILTMALILFVPSVRDAFQMVFPGWMMTAFTLVPAAAVVSVMSLVRAVKEK